MGVKFKNKQTGEVSEPHAKPLIERFRSKTDIFEEINDKVSEKKEATDTKNTNKK